MTKIISLNNIGTKGINSDIKPWELPPEFITAGKNFRLTDGSISASGGSQVWSTAPSPFFPGRLRFVPALTDNYWLVFGRGAVYAFDGTTWSNVSSEAGYAGVGVGDESLWNSCMLGQIPICNNPQARPEYWSPQSPAQVLKPLPFNPTETWGSLGYTCKVMRSHKNFLFALNLVEGGNELPSGYRWSHPADINGLPFSWDETDPSCLGSKEQIGGDSGQIIDGLSLRDSFCIYSENAINLLDSTGDEFVFRRRELTSTFGLLNKDCIAEVQGSHFFLGDGDIVVNNGNKVESIIHGKLRRQLISRMSVDSFDKSFVVQLTNKKEIWFCVPEDDSPTPNVAYIYNWRDDSWAIRDLPESINSAANGVATEPSTTWDTWDETWDTASGTWGSRKSSPLDDTLVATDPETSSLILLDPSGGETDMDTVIERIGVPLEGHTNVTTITRVYPIVEGNTPMIFQFGSQDFAGSAVRWKPQVMFNPQTQRKIDIRTTGELHCWRAMTMGSGGFEMSGMEIEYEEAGKR